MIRWKRKTKIANPRPITDSAAATKITSRANVNPKTRSKKTASDSK